MFLKSLEKKENTYSNTTGTSEMSTQVELPSRKLLKKEIEIQDLRSECQNMSTKIQALTQELQTANMCLALRRKERAETRKELERLQHQVVMNRPEVDDDDGARLQDMKKLQRKVLILSNTVQTLQSELERIKMMKKSSSKKRGRKRRGKLAMSTIPKGERGGRSRESFAL